MARVPVMRWFNFVEVDGEKVETTTVECPRCGLRVSAPGVTPKDARRCVAMLRKSCPHGEANVYVLEYLKVPEEPPDGAISGPRGILAKFLPTRRNRSKHPAPRAAR